MFAFPLHCYPSRHAFKLFDHPLHDGKKRQDCPKCGLLDAFRGNLPLRGSLRMRNVPLRFLKTRIVTHYTFLLEKTKIRKTSIDVLSQQTDPV